MLRADSKKEEEGLYRGFSLTFKTTACRFFYLVSALISGRYPLRSDRAGAGGHWMLSTAAALALRHGGLPPRFGSCLPSTNRTRQGLQWEKHPQKSLKPPPKAPCSCGVLSAHPQTTFPTLQSSFRHFTSNLDRSLETRPVFSAFPPWISLRKTLWI